MTVIAACAYKRKNNNHQALSLLNDIKGKNKTFLMYLYTNLGGQGFQSEEFQRHLSNGYDRGMISLSAEITNAVEALKSGNLPEQINGLYIEQCYHWLLSSLPRKKT